MSLKLIFTAIITVAKVIPKVLDAIESLYSMFLDWKIEQIKDTVISKEQKKFLILDKIKEAKSDEERKILSVVLSDINKLQ